MHKSEFQRNIARTPRKEAIAGVIATTTPFLQPLILIACVGTYGAGAVASVVPFQQYLAKQFWHTDGDSVSVFQKLRASIAHPMQAGHSLSIVPFPLVATLYPFWIIELRCVSLVSS